MEYFNIISSIIGVVTVISIFIFGMYKMIKLAVFRADAIIKERKENSNKAEKALERAEKLLKKQAELNSMLMVKSSHTPDTVKVLKLENIKLKALLAEFVHAGELTVNAQVTGDSVKILLATNTLIKVLAKHGVAMEECKALSVIIAETCKTQLKSQNLPIPTEEQIAKYVHDNQLSDPNLI